MRMQYLIIYANYIKDTQFYNNRQFAQNTAFYLYD